ncbi:NUDIX domain-containing protein [Candidatus Woesearchaeota archaeon]|nr:NUDIX domain-containing protein [Candidatus Woesearchaeota archaeon]
MKKSEYPEVAVGALIFNDKGEIFLIKSPKYHDQYIVPGGHVELGEKLEKAIIREIKEETDLDIEILYFLEIQDNVYNLYEHRHFIFIDYVCKALTADVKLDPEEASDYKWITPEKALNLPDLGIATKGFIENFLSKKKNSYLEEFKRLYEIELNLRKKCPWDKKQTIETMKNHFFGEAKELAEAFDEKDYRHLGEEIGDVLQTLLMMIIIGKEKGVLDLSEILKNTCEKMIRRHPHVFGELKDKNLTVEQILENWKKIKEEEKKRLSRK